MAGAPRTDRGSRLSKSLMLTITPCAYVVVRKKWLEPSRYLYPQILSLLCLPIPPHPHLYRELRPTYSTIKSFYLKCDGLVLCRFYPSTPPRLGMDYPTTIALHCVIATFILCICSFGRSLMSVIFISVFLPYKSHIGKTQDLLGGRASTLAQLRPLFNVF